MNYRLLILALGTFAVGTDSYVVAGILPSVARSFDLGVAAAGQLVTVYSLAYAVLTPIMATLTARWPRRRVLIGGLVVFVAGNVLTGTLRTFGLALVARSVAGLGAAMFSPAASATAASLVAPERRGSALAIVIAGLSAATALGAPIGTLVASLGDWRTTMWFVSGLGTAASLSVLALLRDVPAAPAPRLRARLAPLGDARVGATLATTVLVMFGVFLVYTYITVVFDRATGGDGAHLAALISVWGISATIGNLAAGHLTDRFGSRRIVNLAILIVALDFALMPWSSASFGAALFALAVWGFCGWGLIVSQQHRLIGIAPALAPILLALNAAAIYLAVSASGVVGGLVMGRVGPHDLPFVSTVLILGGIATAELAHRLIHGAAKHGPGAAGPGRRGEAGGVKAMERTSNSLRRGALALSALLAAGCGSLPSDGSGRTSAPPAIESFTAASSAVHVGESTQLTAVFSGDSASIDRIGPVESGVPVTTPALARATTFMLTVRRGSESVDARLTITATYRDRFRKLAPSPVAYTRHLAMALADGGALLMGGHTSESPNIPDADSSLRFDPVTETVSPGPRLAFSAEADLTVPAALDGGFLLIGPGVNGAVQVGSGMRATQAFDATAGAFHQVGDLAFRHDAGGTATALGDGSVFVVGGPLPAVTTAERYDPTSERWSLAGDTDTPRTGHTATRLADGRVLIAGGVTSSDSSAAVLTDTAEVYDPGTGVFEPTGPLVTARALHTATLLADGRVLVTGGIVAIDGTPTADAEVYDPSRGHFSPAGAMQVGRVLHSAILLTDGRVLVLGGLRASAATDVFDPTADAWRPGPILEPAWGSSTATLLRDGRVLVFGGEDAREVPVSTVILYE